MAKIHFSKGDYFQFNEGFGVVIADGFAFLIKGSGGRTGYTQEIVAGIPDSAIPCQIDNLKFEVSFALHAVNRVVSF